MILRTEEEIEKLDDIASKTEHNSKFKGMSYEQGIRDTIMWLKEENPDDLLDD